MSEHAQTATTSRDRHDYEPSNEKPRPMSSEPPCAACGNSRDSYMHTEASR